MLQNINLNVGTGNTALAIVYYIFGELKKKSLRELVSCIYKVV